MSWSQLGESADDGTSVTPRKSRRGGFVEALEIPVQPEEGLAKPYGIPKPKSVIRGVLRLPDTDLP